MPVAGVIVNGRVELAEPGSFPEGASVNVVLDDDEALNKEIQARYDRGLASGEIAAGTTMSQWAFAPKESDEEFLQALRESHAEAEAGLGMPVGIAFAQLRAELGRIPDSDGSL